LLSFLVSGHTGSSHHTEYSDTPMGYTHCMGTCINCEVTDKAKSTFASGTCFPSFEEKKLAIEYLNSWK